MKAVEIVREELARVNLQLVAPIELRRKLVNLAKRAIRQGRNPRPYISNQLRITNRINPKFLFDAHGNAH